MGLAGGEGAGVPLLPGLGEGEGLALALGEALGGQESSLTLAAPTSLTAISPVALLSATPEIMFTTLPTAGSGPLEEA